MGDRIFVEWISVKDKAPDPKQKILVFGKCGMMHVPIYSYDDWSHTEHCDDNGWHCSGDSIEFTHWMPLPEPPKTKRDKELEKKRKEQKLVGNPIYRPPTSKCIAPDCTFSVKFSQARRLTDDWYLFGGTKWSRTLFRLRHPIVYSKRGLRNLYRRVRRLFVEDRSIQC